MRFVSLIRQLLVSLLVLSVMVTSGFAKESALPDYLENANNQVAHAESVGRDFAGLADDILLAKNALRTANAEYTNNLGTFSGKLDVKAEPKVRHLAEMASLQAALVIAKAGTSKLNAERLKMERQIRETSVKIKVFDDLVLHIKKLKTQVADQGAAMTSLRAELEAERRLAASSTDRRIAAQTQELQALKQELQALKQKTAQMQVTEQQLATEKRIKSFEAEAGQLGGVVKADASGLTVTFPRSQILKVTGKSTTLTPVGDNTIAKLAELLTTYQEYRVKLRVHGFGQPSRNEDAAATDQMARFVRDALLTRGKLEPPTVEALGVGTAEPAYPKNNVEGNRRVEIIFVKK